MKFIFNHILKKENQDECKKKIFIMRSIIAINMSILYEKKDIFF